MVTNKNLTDSEHAVINLNGATKTYKKAAVYGITAASTDIKLLDVVDVSGSKVDVTLPAYCAAMIVVSNDADAFSNAQQEEKIEKSTVYDDPESMVNKNGYVEIPITDPEHLKKIVITGDVSSKLGSGWGSAGCAVCINAITPDGTKFWTYKGYSLNLGNGSKAIVDFDGTLTKEDPDTKEKEDLTAVVADGKIELQMWWYSSERDEAGESDDISVKYQNVEVIYEYSGDEPAAVQGDVNGDGVFDRQDAAALQQYLLTKGQLKNMKAGDLDGNGILSAADLAKMKQQLMNA